MNCESKFITTKEKTRIKGREIKRISLIGERGERKKNKERETT